MVGGLIIHPSQHEHIKCLLNTYTHTNSKGPRPHGASTPVALWRAMCLCVRLNNLTRAIPPLLLCLITPYTFSVLSRGGKRDGMDFKQHLGGWGGKLKRGETEKSREWRGRWWGLSSSSIDVVQISEGLVDPQWAWSRCSPIQQSVVK